MEEVAWLEKIVIVVRGRENLVKEPCGAGSGFMKMKDSGGGINLGGGMGACTDN